MSGQGKSSEKGSSKADTLVKVVLVFFISLLSFSVGTFVGKQVSDSDHRRMALEGEYKGDRSVASTDEKGEGEKAEGADKITEKEVENLTEEFVNKEKSREPAAETHAAEEVEHEHADHEGKAEAGGYKTYEHGHHGKVAGATKDTETHGDKSEKGEKSTEAGESKPTAKTAHAPKPDATHKIAEKVVDGKAPTDGKKEERKPQSVLPSVAGTAIGKYAVQVAAYADEKEAKNHIASLKEKGFTAFYLSANVNGKTWFRVLVGLFDNVKNADEYRAQVIKDLGTPSAVVRKIVE